MIRLDGAELMSTRSHTSEERLATLACAHLKDVRRARVLIGGLGLGFTLRAALKVLAHDATVVVAEMMACVIAWNRNPAYGLAADVLADPRVILRQQDVAEAIGATRGLYDAIALDVDNGPNALCLDGNYRLYNDSGLRLARAALRPGGCLALWCASPNPGFEKFLTEAGFAVTLERLRSRGGAGRMHGVLLARAK
jgi:spermidine synthase